MRSKISCIRVHGGSLLFAAAIWLVSGLAAAVVESPPPGRQATETYQGMPVGFTVDGYPFRGNPDAPLTVVEYTDYACPFCEAYFRQTLPSLLEKYVRTGQVKFVVRDFPLASLHPTAPKGAMAVACVAEEGATRFWQMHDAIYQAQQQWSRLPDPSPFLAELAKKAGANMKAYEECMASGRNDARVQQSVAAAQAQGFSGTPSFQFVRHASGKTFTLVGAQPMDVFASWMDTLLAGNEPPQAKEPEKPELPLWAKAEGLAPDPKRPGFTVAGDRYRGDPNARLVVVEFGDFECPSCQRHALTTQPELDKRFVDTGQVMWVVKHFPLRIHPHAPVAAAAAECAGDQGKFWLMHHLLYERSEQWSAGNDADVALVKLAVDLKLDKAQFSACLAGRNALERVLRDLYDGQAAGLRNSPTFVMLSGGAGDAIVGARSTEQFATTLQQRLDKAKAPLSAGDSTASR